jgi:hypothetical protein
MRPLDIGLKPFYRVKERLGRELVFPLFEGVQDFLTPSFAL